MTLRDGVALLQALQGCMKQPVVGRAGGIACARKGGAKHLPPLLAGKEAEVKTLLAEGLTMTSIAEKMDVSRKTLRNYIESKGLKRPTEEGRR